MPRLFLRGKIVTSMCLHPLLFTNSAVWYTKDLNFWQELRIVCSRICYSMCVGLFAKLSLSQSCSGCTYLSSTFLTSSKHLSTYSQSAEFFKFTQALCEYLDKWLGNLADWPTDSWEEPKFLLTPTHARQGVVAPPLKLQETHWSFRA